MSKVLTILALSLGVATAANAGSSRPHYTYASVNHQSQTNAISETVTAAPEIDPASAISAFTLLAGGLAVVRGRRAALSAIKRG
jgi:uncharacterized ion transporter superfamily protein YfcC